MKTNNKHKIVLEDLVLLTILHFCENLAELGCPMNNEPDMWFRYLPLKKARKVCSKLLNIIKRNIINESKNKNITIN